MNIETQTNEIRDREHLSFFAGQDMQAMLDDETRAREDLRDQYQLTERRAMMLVSELEETRTLLEQVSLRWTKQTLLSPFKGKGNFNLAF